MNRVRPGVNRVSESQTGGQILASNGVGIVRLTPSSRFGSLGDHALTEKTPACEKVSGTQRSSPDCQASSDLKTSFLGPLMIRKSAVRISRAISTLKTRQIKARAVNSHCKDLFWLSGSVARLCSFPNLSVITRSSSAFRSSIRKQRIGRCCPFGRSRRLPSVRGQSSYDRTEDPEDAGW